MRSQVFTKRFDISLTFMQMRNTQKYNNNKKYRAKNKLPLKWIFPVGNISSLHFDFLLPLKSLTQHKLCEWFPWDKGCSVFDISLGV